MSDNSKVTIAVVSLLILALLGSDCNRSTIEMQKEKTRQLQIIQSIQMYRLDNDLPVRISKEQKFI